MRPVLYQTVYQALYATLARNLHGAPAADDLPDIAEVMAEDLRIFGYGEQHVALIEDAINGVARNQNDWPTVFQVRQAVREASHQRMMQCPRLPAPPLPDSYWENGRKRLAALRKQLTASMTPSYRKPRPHPERPKYDEDALIAEAEQRRLEREQAA